MMMFSWCHIRHLNSFQIHPERVRKQDKELINTADYEIEVPVSKKVKNKICVIFFCYEHKLTYPVHISDQKFGNQITLCVHQKF